MIRKFTIELENFGEHYTICGKIKGDEDNEGYTCSFSAYDSTDIKNPISVFDSDLSFDECSEEIVLADIQKYFDEQINEYRKHGEKNTPEMHIDAHAHAHDTLRDRFLKIDTKRKEVHLLCPSCHMINIISFDGISNSKRSDEGMERESEEMDDYS